MRPVSFLLIVDMLEGNLEFGLLLTEQNPMLSTDFTADSCEIVRKQGSPIDRWLKANCSNPSAAFLADYLMMTDVGTDYVTCSVERICIEVCHLYIHTLI